MIQATKSPKLMKKFTVTDEKYSVSIRLSTDCKKSTVIQIRGLPTNNFQKGLSVYREEDRKTPKIKFCHKKSVHYW